MFIQIGFHNLTYQLGIRIDHFNMAWKLLVKTGPVWRETNNGL